MQTPFLRLREQDRIKKLLNETLNPDFFDVEELVRPRVIEDYHHKEFTEIIPTTTRIVSCEKMNLPIASEFFEKFPENWFEGIYVHGSYATGFFKKSSDLDLTIIISDEAAKSARTLREMRNAFRGIKEDLLDLFDPLCHHGPYFLTNIMLRHYLECYLPIAVWESTRTIYGTKEHRFHVVSSPYHDRVWWRKSVDYYNWFADCYYLDDEYSRKRYACMLNMVPAVWHPAHFGYYRDKHIATDVMVETFPVWGKVHARLSYCRDDNDYSTINPEFAKHVAGIIRRIDREMP